MSEPVITSDSDDDIVLAGRLSDAPIGAARPTQGVRWLRILVWFMRLAALIWMAKGLLHWGFIVGLNDAGFPDLRLSRMGIVMLSAVLDLVAAVGLWLTSSWGAAVWIVLLFIEGSLPFTLPDLKVPLVETIVCAGAGALYLGLLFMARREQMAGHR